MASPSPGLPPHVDTVCRLARLGREEGPPPCGLSPTALEQVIETAHAHNALGVILQALRGAGPELPAHLLERLTTIEISLAVQALFCEQELQAVLRILGSADVDVAVLKGAFLASCLYGDFAQRPMGDFDLLVRREDLPRAAAALQREGYTCEDRLPDREEPGGESHFRSPAGQAIELHYNLTQGTRLRGTVHFGEAEMWQRRRAFATRTGHRLWSLDPTDHLLYLSYHAGMLHLFAALIWLVDVDRFVRRFRRDIAWTDLPGRARRTGCATCVWHCLALARQLLGTPCDEAVLHALRPARPRAALVQRWLTARTLLRGLAPPTSVRLPLLQMLLLDTTRADLRSLWQGLFPPRQWLEWRYQTSNPATLLFRRTLYPLGGWLRRPQ